MIKEDILLAMSELEKELLEHDCIYDVKTVDVVECKVCDDFDVENNKLLSLWKECQHVDYTDTLDGVVCNDCNLVVGDEE